jgi:hypothetical protein
MSILQLGKLAGFIDYIWSLWNITDIFSGILFLYYIPSLSLL